MKSDQFDRLARRLGQQTSRRTLLASSVAGSAAAVLAPVISAGPISTTVAMAQAEQRRSAGAPDIAKLAFDLEYDKDQIFAFVATQIAYEPYAGVLRGPVGTMWGKSGNSMDQALLLQALLNESSIANRLVQGALSEDMASKLRDTINQSFDEWSAAYQDATGPNSLGTTDAAIESTPVPSVLDDLASKANALHQEFTDTIRCQVLEQSKLITDQLSLAGKAVAQTSIEIPSREISLHTWVQVANGTEWEDLDASIPNAAASQRYAGDFTVLDEIGSDQLHQVTFRLLGDVISGDSVAQNQWLTQTLPSSQLVGQAINLFHVKPGSIGVSIDSAIAGKDPYVAVPQVGETAFEGPLFGFTGQEGALSALGDGGITDGEPVAEWLEITVSGPDLPDIVEMRALFDRIGDEARGNGTVDEAARELKPIVPYPMQDEATGPFFLPLAGVINLAVVSATVPGVYFKQDWSVPDTAGDLSVQNHAYHFVRDALAQEIGNDLGVRTFRDRPTVTALGISINADAENALSSTISLDLVQPTTTAVPLVDQTAPFHPQILEGTLNQIVEHNYFEFGSRLSDASLPEGFISVSKLMRTAIADDIPLVTFDQATEKEAASDQFSASALKHMQAFLADGYVIISPTKPVAFDTRSALGFWAVDPATGRTLDRMGNGGGNALPENATLLDAVLHYIHEYYVLANCVAGAGLAAGGLLSIAIDGYSDAALATAVGGAVHGAGFCLGAASGAGWFGGVPH